MTPTRSGAWYGADALLQRDMLLLGFSPAPSFAKNK